MKYIQKKSQNIQQNLIKSMSNKFNLPINIVKLLFMRGLTDEIKINKFLNPSSCDLYNPFLLKNMTEVVERINYHIENKSKIVILGDYDVDGISASAIMYLYLTTLSDNIEVFIPNRIADGYGMTIDTIDKIKSMYNPNLIITVDCGVSCFDEVLYTKQLGIEIIVTDHHEIPKILPDCLILNAKLLNQQYPFKELCGAGIALKLVHALGGLKSALTYITICSLATVGDIVPLIDENRVIVTLGLKYQKEQLPKGLKYLLKETKILLPLSSTDISYKLAPKINATGRMGDPMISFKLFISQNNKDIENNVKLLLELNNKRIESTNIMFNNICEKINNMSFTNKGIIVLKDNEWESGVLGILASKIAEMYNIPVCLLTEIDGVLKGSLRSIEEIDIYDALDNVKSYLIRFGGHKQAGGISLKTTEFEAFKNAINDYILAKYKKEDFDIKKYYDLDITKDNIDIEFIEKLSMLEPYGFGNLKPLFKISTNNLKSIKLPKFPQHIKFELNNLNFIAFNYGNEQDLLNSPCNKDILFELDIDKFCNKVKTKALVKSINYSKLYAPIKQDYIVGNYISQMQIILNDNMEIFDNIYNLNNQDIMNKISSEIKNQTTNLIICYDFNKYNIINEKFNFDNISLYNVIHNIKNNTIIFAPNNFLNMKNFDNVYLIDKPIKNDIVKYLASRNKQVFVGENKINIKKGTLSNSRELFVMYFNAIKILINRNYIYVNQIEMFETIIKLDKKYNKLSYPQFIFILNILFELNIIFIKDNILMCNKDIKTDLNNSTIYNSFLLI